MGTTLTGTTPQDTYDSLIKVTDNGPLSGTAKYLSDGLGNDSVLALSTGNIGIGTTSPSQPLVVFKANAADDIGQIIQQGANGTAAFLNIVGNNDAGASFNRITSSTSGGTAHWQIGGGGAASTMVLLTGGSERMRITSAGNVGIGTSAPAQRLDISNGAIKFDRILTGALTCNDSQGLIYNLNNNIGSQDGLRYTARTHRFVSHADAVYATIDADGLKFGSDTAAANALDDYEEGTFTPTYAGGLTGVTYSTRYGSYTKIGNRVMFDLRVQASAVTGASGTLLIGGLPFATNGAVISNATIGYFGVYNTGIVYCLIDAGTTNALLFYKNDATSLQGSELTADTSAIHLSGVYFV